MRHATLETSIPKTVTQQRGNAPKNRKSTGGEPQQQPDSRAPMAGHADVRLWN